MGEYKKKEIVIILSLKNKNKIKLVVRAKKPKVRPDNQLSKVRPDNWRLSGRTLG